ncbi:hypothetical protein Tco_0699512 [Tanacetum coccineum]
MESEHYLLNYLDSPTSQHVECLKLNASPLKHVKRGRDTKIPQSSGPPVKVGDEAVHKELGDRMERAVTTASSLEVEQDSVTARTTNDGEVEITISIDGQVKTITEASLRRHLKLEDSDGTLFSSVEFPTQTQVADEAAFTSVDVDAGGASTTDISFEAVHTLGSDEGSLQQNELMDLVTKLTDRVEVLENDLHQIKKMMKIDACEEDSSNQGRKISEIDKDPTILLVHPEQDMEFDFDLSTAEGFTTASVPATTTSASISTVSPLRVSIAKDISGAETLVYIRRSEKKRKDKGKAIMKEDESIQKKAKKQLEQERLGHKEAIILQEQIY